MNQRQLDVFITIAKFSSIKKAADTLFISQPAVSKTLRELEEEVGTPLFDRLGGRLHLNSAGHLFQTEAAKILADYDHLHHLFSPDQNKIPIRIGVSRTYGEILLIPALQKFQTLAPATPTPVTITNAQTILQKLIDHELDLAITAQPIKNPRFASIDLGAFPLVFVGTKKHLPHKQISLTELAQTPLLLREVGSSFFDNLQTLFNEAGLSLRPIWRSSSTDALIKGAVAGFGVTLIPQPFIPTEILEKITVATLIDHPLEHRNYLVYLKEKESIASFKTLTDCFLQTK